MITHKVALFLQRLSVALLILVPMSASAIDWNITGFVRQEIGIGIATNENEFNQSGNPFNGRIVDTELGALSPTLSNGVAIPGVGQTVAPVGNNGFLCKNQSIDPTCGSRNALDDEINFNLFSTRLEVDIQAKFSRNFNAFAKFRGYYDATSKLTDARIGDVFSQPFWWNGNGNPLEFNTPSFVGDLPAFYFDYNKGPLWVRVGQQQIAWGEALFFRVMDVANGLDLRRHLTLGPAGEEFQDQRIAMPGVRVSYTFDNGWELDSFAQLFTPSVLPRTNTPYNVVPAAFSWDEADEFEDAEGSINFGARLTMPLTDSFTAMLMYTNRRNPDGVVRWQDAPRVWHGNPLAGAFGGENPFCAGPNNPFGVTRAAAGIGGDTCGSFFAPDNTGTTSAREWFHFAGRTRLNPVLGVATSLAEAPASNNATFTAVNAGFNPGPGLAATPQAGGARFDLARGILDSFFGGFGPLRGWITREFKREHIIGVGGNYIFTSDNEWLDQLIVRGEVAVTPDKYFTDLSLSRNFIRETEVVSALILEKYQRFSDRMPATYMVAQWMHREQSDLFGRHLSGNENFGLDCKTSTGANRCFGEPLGQDGADYVAFAFQQPFPNLIWRFDFAILVDVQGGMLVQPGVRYRPSADWQIDLYANVIEGGGDENDDVLETLDFADEIFARFTYFF